MFRHSFSLLFSLIGPVVVAAPAIQAKAIKPAYFLLAGDSTTATQSADGGGWGDGFLNYTLASSSTGHNYGHDGATTASFRAGGDWATVLSGVQSFKSEYTVYVAIQVSEKLLMQRDVVAEGYAKDQKALTRFKFGHNDQKNTSGVTLAQYQQNLQNFATEATSAGATPVSMLVKDNHLAPFQPSPPVLASSPSCTPTSTDHPPSLDPRNAPNPPLLHRHPTSHYREPCTTTQPDHHSCPSCRSALHRPEFQLNALLQRNWPDRQLYLQPEPDRFHTSECAW